MSNQTVNKTENELSSSENRAENTRKSSLDRNSAAKQMSRDRNKFSSDILKRRDIRRSGERVQIEKQKEAPSVTITDEMRKQLIKGAKQATREKRYQDVIKITDAILKARPDDKIALALQENAQILQEDQKHEQIMAQIEKVDLHERNRYFENLKEKSLPYNDLMQFTTEERWEEIGKRTQKEDSGKRLEENRKHTKRLKLSPSLSRKPISQNMQMKLKERMSIEFVDTPLRDVISFLQEKSKTNFYLDKNAPEINVNIKLNDVPLSKIIEYILPAGLGYVVKDNIIHVAVEPVELRVYDVRDLLINLEDRQSLKARADTAAYQGGTAVVGEAKDTFDRVNEIIDLITHTIEPASWSVNGGKGLIAAREGMLGDIVVTHNAEVHKQVEDLLAALRSSADLQIAIEARFVAVSDNFLEEFGHNILDFDTTSSRPSATRPKGTPGENTSGGREGGVFTDTNNTFAGTGVIAGTNGLNLSYQILNGVFLEGFLRAVQESEEAETLTAPKITLSNTQRGTIKVVTTFNYIETFSIVSATPQPVVKQIDSGTTLNVRPVVSADRKYVYLEVHPLITDVTFDRQETFETTAAGTGGTSGGAVTKNIIQLPTTVKQELSVTVCVPDKGILMIGGLGSRTETQTSNGTPILSKIPIIKRFFSSNKLDRDITTAGNLIIFIKPTILIREEEEGRAFTRGKRDVEIRLPTYGR